VCERPPGDDDVNQIKSRVKRSMNASQIIGNSAPRVVIGPPTQLYTRGLMLGFSFTPACAIVYLAFFPGLSLNFEIRLIEFVSICAITLQGLSVG
jgi:hypothetical protein